MEEEAKKTGVKDKITAAVCGLYCEACTLFIATTEDSKRLKRLAKQFQLSEETMKCYGCRSDKRYPNCDNCKMFSCAAEKGIDFCSECEKFPCEDLIKFQSGRPHRIELWDNLKQIKVIGYKQWLNDVRNNYACPQCHTINSAYDFACRKCGQEPSCDYVAKHKKEIEQYIANL